MHDVSTNFKILELALKLYNSSNNILTYQDCVSQITQAYISTNQSISNSTKLSFQGLGSK